MKFSVIVFSKNEADNIKACLESAQWAEEIVLIDDYSQDETVKLAQEFDNVKVVQHSLKDFASQHNFGMKQAIGDWLFFLDADERISAELKKQIQAVIKNPQKQAAFQVNRINIFLGQRMKYGGWSPDRPTRLFKTINLRGWRGILHESSIVDGEIGYLDGQLYHFSHRGLSSMLNKTIAWSKMEAQLRLDAGHPPVTWWRVLRIGLSEFFNRLLIKQAWRDGMAGWIEVIYQSNSLMITYLRLWEIQS